MDLVFEILKWVLIVFIAGVIGQLGKSLTLKILDMRRQKKAAASAETPAAPAESPPALSEQPPLSEKEAKERAKAQKKLAKAEVKRRKKASD